jgi:hypothetical protein
MAKGWESSKEDYGWAETAGVHKIAAEDVRIGTHDKLRD